MNDAGNDPRSYVKGSGTEGNMNIVSNFRIHDRRKIECMHKGVVELPPTKGNYPQSLKAGSVTGTAKLRRGTVENTILSLSFDVFHDVSIHPPVQPYVCLSVHLSIVLNTRVSIMSPMEPLLPEPHILLNFL